MKIRLQLVSLVAAVVAPIALLAGVATLQMWSLQREAYQERLRERVSGLRLALDTELDATLRVMLALSRSPDLDRPERIDDFAARFERLAKANPHWTTIGLLDDAGTPLARVTPVSVTSEGPVPDAATIAAVTATRRPAISNVVEAGTPPRYIAFLATPVIREDAVRGVLYVGIGQRGWLEFLRRYPIAENATLTLADRHGVILARTLNNDRWVGKRSSNEFMRQATNRDEGAFLNVGLEGQAFYSAFSRSRLSGWLLGTGVPQASVEGALQHPTAVTAIGVLAAATAATLLALLLGRRIARAMTDLEVAAKAMATPERRVPERQLPIDEAETVRRALAEAAAAMTARDEALHAALQAEGAARAQAEHASRAKDEFLAMLGHELRNPLSAMKTANALLGMAAGKPDVERRARDVVDRQIRHLTEIVDELLDVARLNSGKIALNRRALDLTPIVRHVVQAFGDAGRCRHMRIVTTLAPALVFGDETRLEQIVSNLLDNACKYGHDGGTVRIDTLVDGDDAVLTVSDDGAGIPAELLPHVFELFSQGERTLDRAQGGLGLGLTVVRRLVELHGGRIAATSDGADRGATFTIRLPRVAAEPEASAADGAPPALAPTRIAVVEDNVDSLRSIAELLRLSGHAVSEALDGTSGLATILETGARIALVDVGLPGIDGLELARRVRADPRGGDIALIAVTGYGSADKREAAHAAGFDAFLVKPFDAGRFVAAVLEAMAVRASRGA